MDKSYKKPLLLITFGVILFAAFNNLNYVANYYNKFGQESRAASPAFFPSRA